VGADGLEGGTHEGQACSAERLGQDGVGGLGGTASLLRSSGIPVRDVSEVTGFPELMDGRVKTLHPRIHGGILALREKPAHMEALAEHEIGTIDLLCVNLYPFEETIADPDCTLPEAIEQIDIGGPAMIRAAAKNYRNVAVVTSPRRYDDVLHALRTNGASIPEEQLKLLARIAFRLTARYDAAIESYLGGQVDDAFPDFYAPFFEKVRELRYGENPFQRAAVYSDRGSGGPCVASGTLLWGKDPSYNNLIDLDAAMMLVRELPAPASVVIKHTNPSGAALGATATEAFQAAYGGDPLSAFGCVLGFNCVVDQECAQAIAVPEHFVECIVAPGFEPAAIEALTSKTKWGKTLRLVTVENLDAPVGPRDRDVRRILGGVIVQDYDLKLLTDDGLRCMSEREPTDAEVADMEFAWICAKHVKSNAVVIAKDRALVGVGAGQMSRVDATRIAVRKAGPRAKGAVLASDAFFPFADGLEVALEAGVTAAIEPGGSRNDHEVIAAANDAGCALIFTGMRHFRH
jgi:phosphoribosylaminoimidazolecarboxamide formyltransferase/IMP cyclohydrolase